MLKYLKINLCLMVALLLIAIIGCNNSENSSNVTGTELTEENISMAAEKVINSEDSTYFYSLSMEMQDVVAFTIIDKGLYPKNIENDESGIKNRVSTMSLSLPDCGGYWTTYWLHEVVEQRDTQTGLLYEVGPNCYMDAPGTDCGNDDDDYMLSFYFGRHNESISQLAPKLKWYSTNWLVRVLLGDTDVRIYQQTPETGADNYDIKMCLDDYFQPYFETFRLRKY